MQQSRRLALACLRVMNAPSGLKFNICSLRSSHDRNVDITDLPDRIQQSISAVLSYTCRFVGDHMNFNSDDEQTEDPEDRRSMQEYYKSLRIELRHFFQDHFLYWLEVLSLEKHMNTASRSLIAILEISMKEVILLS